MDGVGNRTSVVDDGKVTYATNSVNEYVYVDNQRLMYDRNGNMTSDGNLRMAYDHNNMLVEIRTGQYVFHQRFDAIGRRLMVQFSDGLTETRYFWHDGQQVIYEEVSGLTEPYRYVWGNGIDEALLRFGNLMMTICIGTNRRLNELRRKVLDIHAPFIDEGLRRGH